MFNKKQIEKFKKISTPFYFYDLSVLEQNLKALKRIARRYDYRIHYALKANVNIEILQLIRQYGLGADCVSGNEIQRALEAGFPAKSIVFAGVGKTDAEIEFALQKDIQCFNCESMQELEVINRIAKRMKKIAPVALRLNPNLDAGTHDYITTGREEDKFGIPTQQLPGAFQKVQELKNLQLMGIHFHIGSQITDLTVYRFLCEKVNEIQEWFYQRGIRLPHLNLGGGLGVDYANPDEHLLPAYEEFFQIFNENLKIDSDQVVHFELGRAIVAQCGALITRVLYIKPGLQKQFVIVDAGMTELIRPALYRAYHKIENLSASGREAIQRYDIVGPVCESSDFFGRDVALPETRRGDILAIRTTGAYAQVMASRYNLRDLAPAVYSEELH